MSAPKRPFVAPDRIADPTAAARLDYLLAGLAFLGVFAGGIGVATGSVVALVLGVAAVCGITALVLSLRAPTGDEPTPTRFPGT